MKGNNKFILLAILFSLLFLEIFSNNEPVFTSLPDEYLGEFEFYNYYISAFDNDNDSIIFLCLEKPDWLTINTIDKNNAILYGSTSFFFDSIHINIAITDGIDTTYQLFYVKLSCVNESPVITSSPITLGYVDSLYMYNIQGIDAYCQVNFSPVLLPEWLSLNNNQDNEAILTGNPTISDTGVFHIIVEVYRDCEICTTRYSQNYDLRIVKNNSPPIINSLPHKNATLFQIYQYDLAAIDADGDSLYVFAENIPNWLNLNDNKDGTAVISGIPSTYSDMNDTSVIICVTDNMDTVKQIFNIKLSCIPTIPNIITSPDTLALVNEEYSYLFQVTDIENENLIIYCKDLPQWLSYHNIDNQSILIFGTPLNDNIGLYDVSIVCKYEIDKPCHDSISQIFKLKVISTSNIQLNETNSDLPFIFEQNSNCIRLKLKESLAYQRCFIRLINLSGQDIFNLSSKIIDNEIDIKTDQIKSGIYILYIRKDNINNSFKLFIK